METKEYKNGGHFGIRCMSTQEMKFGQKNLQFCAEHLSDMLFTFAFLALNNLDV